MHVVSAVRRGSLCGSLFLLTRRDVQVQNALDSLSAASKVICQVSGRSCQGKAFVSLCFVTALECSDLLPQENGKQKVYLALQETVAQTPEASSRYWHTCPSFATFL